MGLVPGFEYIYRPLVPGDSVIQYDNARTISPLYLPTRCKTRRKQRLRLRLIKMPWDDWRKDFNKKLDDFGEDAKQKYRQQREVNAGTGGSANKVGLQDRMNMLKGQNPQWDRDVESRTAGTDQTGASTTIVPERTRVPPPPPGGVSLQKATPPPPPLRRGTSGAAAQTAAHTPGLPPRMQNEDGTSNPPPPYPPTSPPQHAYPTSQGAGHIEFSKFTQQDKQAFFALLDEVSTCGRHSAHITLILLSVL